MADDRPARVIEKENEAARNAGYLAALERELEGYKRSGNKDRAAQVEKEIRRVKGGGKDKAPESTASSGGGETATKPSPAKRSSSKKSTAKSKG